MRTLVVEKQPTITAGLGNRLDEFKSELNEVVDAAARAVPELFAASSDPDVLVREPGSNFASNIRLNHAAAIQRLAQPLHDLLANWGFRPDAIKANRPRASYSAFGFTDSDFPLPSWEIKSSYSKVIEAYGKASDALRDARHAASSQSVSELWDR